jgi:hypothetical protein
MIFCLIYGKMLMKDELGLTRLSQVRGKAEDSTEGVVNYDEVEPQALTKKLAKAACKLGLRPSAKRQARKC